MARILLIGPDDLAQENLALTLRAKGHRVQVAGFAGFTSQNWPAAWVSVEVIVFDATELTESRKSLLQAICGHPPHEGGTPLVLCHSRVNHGPQFELAIERIGARFVYAE